MDTANPASMKLSKNATYHVKLVSLQVRGKLGALLQSMIRPEQRLWLAAGAWLRGEDLRLVTF